MENKCSGSLGTYIFQLSHFFLFFPLKEKYSRFTIALQ